jgi:hypothetical protein
MSGPCDEVPLCEPETSPAARQLAAEGFVALWHGRTPHASDLIDDNGTIDELVAAGRLEVSPDGRLVGAHGLATRVTGHRIEHSGGVVHTWCALDAIGIPAALGIDAVAVTTCRTCGQSVLIEVNLGTPSSNPSLRLWLPGGPCSHLVNDFCSQTNLYCNEDHLRDDVPAESVGRSITIDEAAASGRVTWADVAAALEP